MSKAPVFRGQRHTARTLALQVLLDGRRREGFAQELLDRELGRGDLPAADRRLATQLVYGVLRRRGTLQCLLQPLVDRPAEHVEAWLWDALHVGAYQLALLTHMPVHAALHETVELAAQFDRPGAKGFLNGVLRNVARIVTDERRPGPGRDAVPLEGGEFRGLTRPMLPDPRSQPAAYLEAGFGLPGWLAGRWYDRFGFEECMRLGFWFAGPTPLTLRINPLKTSRDEWLGAAAALGLTATAGEHPQAVRLGEHFPVRQLPGYDEGKFSVQDESAMRVGSAVGVTPGMRVLDLCAAPGGKTTHLAELLGDDGLVLACDPDPERLQTVQTLADRLGLRCVQTQVAAGTDAPAGLFDAVLVDAPCGNTGVLGKRPEVRTRLRFEDLRHLVPLQTGLLGAAVERVRPGGVVVFSTCSIEPEENRGVVRRVMAARSDLVLEADEESSPGRPADGGYWARLRRTGSGIDRDGTFAMR